jgi:non-canonical purine NTP pyrophosphatase (RdgB/HAM1 family)
MKTVYLITKNQGKIMAAKSVFDKYGIDLKNIDQEFPEIQADTSLEIAKHSALEAARATKLPVIREDHSLFISALGFPGPYMSFIEKKLTSEKLLNILDLSNDRTGYFEISTVYADSTGKLLEYTYQVPIHFKKEEAVKDPRDGWNGIICLKGENRAFTEYPETERLSNWNKNYIKIAEELSKS